MIKGKYVHGESCLFRRGDCRLLLLFRRGGWRECAMVLSYSAAVHTVREGRLGSDTVLLSRVALQVAWVEHVEVDDRSAHNIYKPLNNSGLTFGAKRWVATLNRQHEHLASLMARNIPSGDVAITTSEAEAERIVTDFSSGMTAYATHQWATLSGRGAEDVRVMTRKSVNDPGRPPGIVLNAVTSFWLLVSPKRIFDFLHDESSRSEFCRARLCSVWMT